MKQKLSLVISLVLCAMSFVFAGLGLLTAVATPNAHYQNPYIATDGRWSQVTLDWNDERQVQAIARSVGFELQLLRETRTLVLQSNNWDFLAAVTGVLAALIASVEIIGANKRSKESLRPPKL